MTEAEQIHNIGRRRAWVIWAVGLSVYGLAVFHRSSLGVAGLLAAERFDIDATRLAFFLGVPALVAAGIYELPDALKTIPLHILIIGNIVSFGVAYASIASHLLVRAWSRS